MTLPRRILFATDFSEPAEEAEQIAVRLAARLSAELHVVHAYEAPAAEVPPHALPLVSSYVEDLRKAAERRLEERCTCAEAFGVEARGVARAGRAIETITSYAKEIGADWIVVGTEGRTRLRRLLLGSVAEGVARHAPCSVLAARHGDGLSHGGPVVLAEDFSGPAGPAREAAVELARAFGTGLHVVHALDFSPVGVGATEVPEPGQLFDILYTAALARIEEFAASVDVPVGIDVVAEAPVPAICAAAEERKAALIVIGTHGRSGLGHALLGSVAERTLRHAPCSVLVARSG